MSFAAVRTWPVCDCALCHGLRGSHVLLRGRAWKVTSPPYLGERSLPLVRALQTPEKDESFSTLAPPPPSAPLLLRASTP